MRAHSKTRMLCAEQITHVHSSSLTANNVNVTHWPQNVLLVKDKGKLCDFGISRLKVCVCVECGEWLHSR